MTPRRDPEPYAALDTIVEAARRVIAAGGPLDLAGRSAELDATALALAAGTHDGPGLAAAAARTRATLGRLAAMARVRERLRDPAGFGPLPQAPPAAPPASPRDSLLIARVTISGNLIVERAVAGNELTVSWKLPPAAQQVIVQVEERPDPRSNYALLAQHELGSVSSWSLALDERPKRLLVRVEGRGGRVLGRARINGLTAANAASKWQRQATAA